MTNSSEAWAARRMALLYQQLGCLTLPRGERLSVLRRALADNKEACERITAEHKASCNNCKTGQFCIDYLSISPAQKALYDQAARVRGAISAEEHDQKYAEKAMLHGVEYDHHIDGFCSYWQNLRYRKFVSVDGKCERCGKVGPLEAHHRDSDYECLGFEDLDDIEALCRSCHQRRHAA